MGNSPLGRAVGAGTVMQVAMVVIGHFVPSLQQAGLFPIGGTLIGLVTGWLAGKGSPAGTNAPTVARDGGIAGGVAGVLGSLVSTALGDVPLVNLTIAGGSTLVTGALGGLLARAMGKKA
ncbi:MAG: hypothetical protein JNJ98_14790 [Gemmatimonadetes bacterium]|nr:hypothetical protein [Gemmatimonadota bacterium]